jgi:hypothetical protein
MKPLTRHLDSAASGNYRISQNRLTAMTFHNPLRQTCAVYKSLSYIDFLTTTASVYLGETDELQTTNHELAQSNTQTTQKKEKTPRLSNHPHIPLSFPHKHRIHFKTLLCIFAFCPLIFDLPTKSPPASLH